MESNKSKTYQRHYEESILIPRSMEEIFAYIDDHNNLSSHMNDSSWMMVGSRMETLVDAERGQKAGSYIRLSGKVFGINLFVDEVVTQYEPPRAKAWETVGDLRLLVIGHYRMNIKAEPQDGNSLLRIAIDYDLPATNAWLGRLFGGFYAKWCVRQMIESVRNHFTK